MTSRVPLRLRVTVAFALAMTISLVGLGVFVYYRVEATLFSQARAALGAQMAILEGSSRTDRAGATSAMNGEFFGQVLTGQGDVVVSSPHLVGPVVEANLLPRPGGPEVVVEQSVALERGDDPEAALVLLRREGDHVLAVGTSKEDLADALGGLRTQLFVGGPLALVLSAFAGYLAAGTALRPMEHMRRRAAAISANSSGERLPLPAARDEVHRLGRTLNEMLDRLDAGLHRERRFVAEASHELRTPLALLKLELELALARPRSPEELTAAIRSAGEEVDRLTRLSEDLLLLAASDDRRLLLDRSDIAVGPMLVALAERFAALADQDGRRITVACDGSLAVQADGARLDRALSNLVDNALRHGAGDVELSAHLTDRRVSIRVADHGRGLPAVGDGARAFERFSRDSASRSRGGRGLGLPIVHAIVAEHDGTVTIADRADTQGVVVTVEISGRRTA